MSNDRDEIVKLKTAMAIMLRVDENKHPLGYDSIEKCLDDGLLAFVIDCCGATATLWCRGLRLTARPITSSARLTAELEAHRKVIAKVVK